MNGTKDITELIRRARQVSQFAYAPYSKFKVGAALLTKSGKIFSGCNVENSSYGLTNCAERVAIAKAVSEGEQTFKAIAIYSPSQDFITPCGACRQVLAEFSNTIQIILCSNKKTKTTTIQKLLPQAFTIKS